jgi:type II secretory pathway pseudopilin PulG
MPLPKTSITNGGSLLVELGLALAIFSITLVALSASIFARYATAVDIEQSHQALFSAVSQLESTRAQESLDIKASSTSTLSLHIKEESPCLRHIFSKATWQTKQNHFVMFDMLRANKTYAEAIDYDCGTNQPIGLITHKYIAGTFLDGLDTAIIVASTTQSTSSIKIFDPALHQLSSIDLDAPIFSIDAIHHKIFAALNATHHQVSVINIQDLSHPFLEASTSLPGVAGSFPGATSISYFDEKLYVGTHRTAGREFHIYTVAIAEPQWLGSIELNHNINSITIREPYAFLATSGNVKDLIILNIADPHNISILSTLDLPGNEDALSLFLTGNTLYLGRKKSLKPSEPDFVIISIEDPQAPVILGTHITNTNIKSIRIAGDTAYLAAQGTHSSLITLNVTDPKNITSSSTKNISGDVTGIDLQQPYLYITSTP